MSLNATLLIQMTVFAVVVLFSMKFIWPMIMEAIEERNKSISDGLAAAEPVSYTHLTLPTIYSV